MKVKYGFQIYRKDQTLRTEESGFFSKDRAVAYARSELSKATDSHAVITSYHYSASRLVQVRHVSRITA